MKPVRLVPNVGKLVEGHTPIAFFASSDNEEEYVLLLLSQSNLDEFEKVLCLRRWKNERPKVQRKNPLINALEEGAGRRDRGGFTDECLRAIASRAFVVRTDNREFSQLVLRMGLGSKMYHERKSSYKLSDVDGICAGKRLPQLQSGTYRRGRGETSVDHRWFDGGLIVYGDESSKKESGERFGSRTVVCPRAFPCLIPFPANKYPCVDEQGMDTFPRTNPFLWHFMKHMRELVESRGEYTLLRLAPGARLLSAEYEPFIDMLSGFDYERRVLRVMRPHRREWENLALFGVMETAYGLNLIGYLLDSITENGGYRAGAKEMVEGGRNPLWRSVPVRRKDLTARDDVCRCRISYGTLLEERDDWDVIGDAIQSGRAIFMERRNYMCAASTDRILRVRITVRPEGVSRFRRIAHTVELRRTSLLGLMPLGGEGARGPRADVVFPTISSLGEADDKYVYEDWVVGRKEFTKFLRRNMDVIEGVEAWYQSDSCGPYRGEEYEQAYNLEDYVPQRTKPNTRFDPYATGYRWSAYRILNRYAKGCADGSMDYLPKEDTELLSGAKGLLEELGEVLEGVGLDA